MAVDGRNMEPGFIPLAFNAVAEYPVENTVADEMIAVVARRIHHVFRLGILVTASIGAGSAAGGLVFGRRRANSNDADYFVASFSIAAETAHGFELWTDIFGNSAGSQKIAWASTANTDRARNLNVGDVVTFGLTGVPGLAGKVVPLIEVLPIEPNPTR